MRFEKLIARNTVFTFIAAACYELSLSSLARNTRDWWSCFIDRLCGASADLTAFIGLIVARFFGCHPIKLNPSLQKADRLACADHRPRLPPIANRICKPSKKERSDRKLALLQRAGLFSADTCGAVIERACSLEDLRKAYRLVHDVYLGTGYINPEPAGLRLRIFETTSETATFVAKVQGRVVGVLSVVGDSTELGLPSDIAFKDELDRLRASGMKLGEVTNQAVSEEYRRSAVPTELMRCAIAHGIKGGYDFAIATVSPSHTGFYELLGFRQVGSKRSYSEKIHDPVIAIGMDMKQYREPATGSDKVENFVHGFLTRDNPYLPHIVQWRQKAMTHFLNPELLHQLFVTERNFLAECSREELQVLHRRWGSELFAAVTGDLFLPNLHPQEQKPSPPILSASSHPESTDRSLKKLVVPSGVELPKKQNSSRENKISRSRYFSPKRSTRTLQIRQLKQRQRY